MRRKVTFSILLIYEAILGVGLSIIQTDLFGLRQWIQWNTERPRKATLFRTKGWCLCSNGFIFPGFIRRTGMSGS